MSLENKSIDKTKNLQQDALVEEAVFLCSHHEVMRLIPVVDNVLEVNASRGVQIFEEPAHIRSAVYIQN